MGFKIWIIDYAAWVSSTLLDWLLASYNADTNGSFPSEVNSPANDWTIVWASFTASGKIDWGYNFDWINDYITLPNGIIPWGTNEMSFGFWLKFDVTWGNRSIMMTARTWQWCLIYQSWGLIVFSKPNVVDLTYAYTQDTNWHNIICCSDGSWMKIVIDDVVVASNTNTANWVDPAWDPMYIWAYYATWTIQSGWYLDWTLDIINTWDRLLTTDEKTEFYNSWTWVQYPFT